MATSREKYFEERGRDLRKSTREKTWNVQHIWDIHHEIKRRLLLGQKNVVIAAAVGCTPQTVSNTRNSPVIERELAIMRGARDAETVDIGKRILDLAPRALDNLEALLRDGKLNDKEASIGLIAKESNTILDRAGWAAPKKLQMESVTMHLTTEDIEAIKRRAIEVGAVIDV